MTIADAFNKIAVKQGGTPDTSGTIAGAIDAVCDAVAGSNVPERATIEDSVALLGEYIGSSEPAPEPEPLTVTENGEYYSKTGYSPVTVEVDERLRTGELVSVQFKDTLKEGTVVENNAVQLCQKKNADDLNPSLPLVEIAVPRAGSNSAQFASGLYVFISPYSSYANVTAESNYAGNITVHKTGSAGFYQWWFQIPDSATTGKRITVTISL